jgi:hypothetical protein
MSIGNLKNNGNKGNNFPYQLAVLELLNSIANSGSNPCCPTAATEATLLTRLSKADFEARINTLGQKTMNESTPVTLAIDQSSIPVTLPAGVSLTPSLVLVPANTALTNTVAGKKQVSMRASGGNVTIGGVAVPNGTTLTYTAEGNNTIGSISYQTGAGSTILISYLT